MQYTIVGADGERNVTLFVPGKGTHVAHSSHPNFDTIVAELVSNDSARTEDGIIELFDISKTIAARFERLSERVTVANGRIYFDGVEIANALTSHILRFLDEDVEDWKPLVNFFEKVQTNPQSHSRNQLYEWLDRHDFTITDSGDIVAYKGVNKKDDGSYVSIHQGPAVVDGEPKNGHIPNAPGSVIEMPRDKVTHDSTVGCSYGLHVGTWSYASSFARGAVLEVHVNPRDVVSVPTDCDAQKVRTCRYKVVDVKDVAYTSPVLLDDWDDEDDWEDDYVENVYDPDDPSTHGAHDPADRPATILSPGFTFTVSAGV